MQGNEVGARTVVRNSMDIVILSQAQIPRGVGAFSDRADKIGAILASLVDQLGCRPRQDFESAARVRVIMNGRGLSGPPANYQQVIPRRGAYFVALIMLLVKYAGVGHILDANLILIEHLLEDHEVHACGKGVEIATKRREFWAQS